MKSCEDYQEMISRMLDGDLDPAERDELAGHVKRCPDCAAVYVAFRSLSEHLGGDLEEVPAGLHENLMANVRRDRIRRYSGGKTARRWRGVLAAAACLALIVAAGLNLPKLTRMGAPKAAQSAASVIEAAEEELPEARKSAGSVEMPAEAPMEAVPPAAAAQNADAMFRADTASSEPASEEAAAEDAICLNREDSQALRALLSRDQTMLPGTPERELSVVYEEEDGSARTVTILLCGDSPVYVMRDGDSYYQISCSSDELLTLLGLD